MTKKLQDIFYVSCE